MRAERAAARAARRARRCETLDVGAGTGFTTEGIVARVDAGARDDARPEPAPARAGAAQAGAARRAASCWATPRRCRSATDALRPLRVGRVDRVLARPAARRSPRPTACCKPGGVALVVGPVPPGEPRRAAAGRRRGCCSRPRREYRAWFERAGLRATSSVRRGRARLVPRPARSPYAVAVSGRQAGRRDRRRSRVPGRRRGRRRRRWARCGGCAFAGALRARLAGGLRVRADRRRAHAAGRLARDG